MPRRPNGSPTVSVPVGLILRAVSPRANGVDKKHVRLLAESGEVLPPILVHRGSMRVIDGMHRLHLARLQGQKQVQVEFFEGDDAAAFLQAVTANLTHGLPLSLADRKAAGLRIMGLFPRWSDRAVAKASGISGKTVGSLRRRAGRALPQADARMGQDGRVRPLDGTPGRRMVGQLIGSRPDASLREIAEAAGVSPSTVRAVRDRLDRGDEAITASQQGVCHEPHGGADGPGHGGRVEGDCLSSLDTLRRDPSLIYTDDGRALLRWLDGHFIDTGECGVLPEKLPAHCIPAVARMARHCSAEWKSLADQLDQRASDIS
jgi:hypothetical protein